MEQAGRLMRTATMVFDAGDASTGVAVAMLGREELGRSRILLERGKAAHAGQMIAADALTKELAKHIEKQRRGALSVVLRPLQGTALSDAFQTQTASEPGSKDWLEAETVIEQAIAETFAAQPAQRHRDRMSAVYLDLDDDGKTWVRLASMNTEFARDAITHAVSDYSVAHFRWRDENLENASLQRVKPEFLLIKAHKPTGVALPPPVWPTLIVANRADDQ